MGFYSTFFALVALSLLVLRLGVVWTVVREPYCEWLAATCGRVIEALVQDVETKGILISAPTFNLSIVRGCDGIEALAIFMSAVIAYPAPWRSRLAAIGWGSLAIFVFNIVRIPALFLLGVHSPRVFRFVHVYLFQASLITAVFALFAWWASRNTRPQLAHTGAGAPVRA